MLNLISACGQVAAHVIYREQGVAGTLHDRRQAKPPHEKRSGLKLSRNEAHLSVRELRWNHGCLIVLIYRTVLFFCI